MRPPAKGPAPSPQEAPLGLDGFAKAFPVSRETLDRLEAYSALLTKWQKAVNLVGPKTLSDLWRRHFLDSAQLVPMIPPQAKTLMDIGSGAGFPGLVLAILGIERPEPLAVHLVESDRKKATFLQEAARVTGAPATVHCARIESLPPQAMDVITARALAPLVDLMAWSQPFWGQTTVGLFLKGQDSGQELLELQLTAPQDFENINIRRWPSRSDARGVVLELARRA